MIFFGGGIWRRLDWMPFFDERVEVNHFCMGAQGFHHGLPCDTSWERGQGSEDGSFRHLECGEVFRISDEDVFFEKYIYIYI
jgi:hypothetical protein